MLLYVLLFTTLASNAFGAATRNEEPQSTCPDEWSLYEADKTCLKLFRDKEAFYPARETCKSEGGDLVIIHDNDKRDFIISTLLSRSQRKQDRQLEGSLRRKDIRKYALYIGVHDENHDGKFTYVDGSELGDYNPWASGEPNHRNNNQFCVHLLVNNKIGGWNDINCDKKYRFVCQKDSEPVPETLKEQEPTTTEEPAANEKLECPESWTLYAAEKTCLKIFQTELTFDKAREVCKSNEGADLVKFHDDAKRQFIFDVMKLKTRVFIGVYDPNHDRNFVYVDGSPLTDYHPWSVGQPDNFKNREFCVDLMHKEDRGWNDISCERERRFICEKDATVE